MIKENTKIGGLIKLRIIYLIVGLAIGFWANARQDRVEYKLTQPARLRYLVDSFYYEGYHAAYPQHKISNVAEL